MAKNTEKEIQFMLKDKNSSLLGGQKEKIIENCSLGVPSLTSEEFLRVAVLLGELVGDCENLNPAFLEPSFGKMGSVTVEKEDYGYVTMDLTNWYVKNFEAYKSCLKSLFGEKYKIREIVLPPQTTKIPANMCKGQKFLEKVTFNDGLEEIGESAFCGCSSLYFDGEAESLPNSLKVIGKNAFADTTSLEQDLVLGENVFQVGEGAFAGSGVYGVSFANAKVEVIPKNCFKNAKNLTAVLLDDCTTVIGESAFEGADSLEEINLSKVEQIDSHAFFTGTERLHLESLIKEFDLSSLKISGCDIVSSAPNSIFVLPENLDKEMAQKARIPLVITVSTKKSSIENLAKYKRNEIKNIVESQEQKDCVEQQEQKYCANSNDDVVNSDAEVFIGESTSEGFIISKMESSEQANTKKEKLRIGDGRSL